MKLLKHSTLLLFAFIVQTTVLAETWNEPWQKEIIQKADYFVLANVVSNVDSIGTEIEIIKYFGTQKLEGRVLINSFSLLQMMSSSGHGAHLNFKKGQTIYFMLTKTQNNSFAIPTPTSGFAVLDDDKNVYATYRHSYHQALVPQHVYEQTYTEIWNYYKNSKFDIANVKDFIDSNINTSPAGFAEDEIATFFLQHVALETAYLLGLSIELERVKPFIESENFHSRVSALRLISNTSSVETNDYLFAFIKKKNENFEKVIAIWSLWETGGEDYQRKLIKLSRRLSNQATGFGGNIMDPRVGTHFPSPRLAVLELKDQKGRKVPY